MKAATTQPIQTNVRPARCKVRSEGMRIPRLSTRPEEGWSSALGARGREVRDWFCPKSEMIGLEIVVRLEES